MKKPPFRYSGLGNARLNSEGFPEDATRLPAFYDGTYEYLKGIGIREL